MNFTYGVNARNSFDINFRTWDYLVTSALFENVGTFLISIYNVGNFPKANAPTDVLSYDQSNIDYGVSVPILKCLRMQTSPIPFKLTISFLQIYLAVAVLCKY